MKPVMQTIFGSGGNCLSACIASLMHLPLGEVPNFHEGVDLSKPQDDPKGVRIFWANVEDFLNSKGYSIMHFEPKGQTVAEWLDGMKGHVLVGGKSPRGYSHMVIYLDGELAHDPHPEGGDVETESISVIYPLFN